MYLKIGSVHHGNLIVSKRAMLTAIRQVSEGKQTNRITLETLCGLFRYASWIDIESDTCFRNITWGSLPVGCQGVMMIPKDFKEKA